MVDGTKSTIVVVFPGRMERDKREYVAEQRQVLRWCYLARSLRMMMKWIRSKLTELWQGGY